MSDNVGSTVARRPARPKQVDEFSGKQLELLVGMAKKGDLSAFQTLYRGYAKRILNYAYRMTGSREDAEDVTQDTFILAYKNLKNLKDNSKFQSWVYRIAQNNVYQKFRAQSPHMESIEATENDAGVLSVAGSAKTPEGALLSKELQQVVQQMIKKLPAKYREVFVLSAVHRYSYEAISEIVGRSLASVKSDIHRARLEVRDGVKKYLGANYGMSKLQG
ncbi:MAG: RNA polymerase sigma factor [Acidobacteria bacterium]|nr:RNA polymerase sigma factor [Acidobacteriota bacterium]